ncbi:hypothetical protein ASZ90_015215 [hydrocarbon metagenome]|uniref:Uncharacterized protein n=1 Tax=hydrocarbon metagenome TaxID=938273 RepID=A0A0W8F2J6_9ZZZZ
MRHGAYKVHFAHPDGVIGPTSHRQLYRNRTGIISHAMDGGSDHIRMPDRTSPGSRMHLS